MHVMYVYKNRGVLPVNIRVEYDVTDGRPVNLRLSIPEHAEHILPEHVLPMIVAHVDRCHEAKTRPATIVEQSTYGT